MRWLWLFLFVVTAGVIWKLSSGSGEAQKVAPPVKVEKTRQSPERPQQPAQPEGPASDLPVGSPLGQGMDSGEPRPRVPKMDAPVRSRGRNYRGSPDQGPNQGPDYDQPNEPGTLNLRDSGQILDRIESPPPPPPTDFEPISPEDIEPADSADGYYEDDYIEPPPPEDFDPDSPIELPPVTPDYVDPGDFEDPFPPGVVDPNDEGF